VAVHPHIAGQCRGELAAPDVETDDAPRAAPQQRIGEAAGALADIEAVRTLHREAAVRERAVELQAAARHEAQLGIVGNLELAFLGQVFARLARHCPALRAEPAHCAGIDQPLRGRTRRR